MANESNKQPQLILARSGFWLSQYVDGVEKSSYLGHLGRVEVVKAWCEERGIEFRDISDRSHWSQSRRVPSPVAKGVPA